MAKCTISVCAVLFFSIGCLGCRVTDDSRVLLLQFLHIFIPNYPQLLAVQSEEQAKNVADLQHDKIDLEAKARATGCLMFNDHS